LRAACLLYHDVIDGDDWDSSGFTGPGTAIYKMSEQQFEAHLAALASVRTTPPISGHELANDQAETLPFLLTFDDGGESAATRIEYLLNPYGWRAHFFVTAGQIGKRGFLNPEQIRQLRKKGHVIGSHSYSHPQRMSHCTQKQLMEEWSRSTQVLSNILGEPVSSASVPGGYYSRQVAETATACGIRLLFTSEPTTKIDDVLGCLVVGRFNLFRGVPPHVAADLVSAFSQARLRQWMYWNAKKIAKKVAGRPYLAARQILLRNR
jgi:peptidoglycan/xylan/chitin deacetylase (PgdA/CDA1 family)